MNIKKFLKYTLIVFCALILISILGMLVWAKAGTYPARMVALSALESTDKVTITQDKWIVFKPVIETETGLIFYPGGLVEPAAYAPILHQIAEESVLVIITPMPLNLAILNTGAANAVIDAYPNISTWILAGHSLGGASAAIFAKNNAERIDAIAMWDSYPPNSADLSDNTISVISIFGTTNDIPNTDNFNDKKHLLPTDTIFIGIEGANHAQFGWYGPQAGDNPAIISRVAQQAEIVTATLDLLAEIEAAP